MADVKVVMQLQDTTEVDTITDLVSSSEVNNASIQKTNGSFDSLSTKNNGTNMKSWAKQTYKNGEYVGSLSLADGYVGGAGTQLIEQYGYNGYVFGAVPENKQLTVTLEVRGENVDSIIIYGDKNANQFPTKAYRDGNPNDIIYSDDPTWAIKFDSVASSHTITFLEWNRANYNACITAILPLKDTIVFDRLSLKNVESLYELKDDTNDINYSIVFNTGSMEILDNNGEIRDYIEDGILRPTETPTKIFVNENLVGNFITSESSYNSQNNILQVGLKDNLQSKMDNTFGGYHALKPTNDPFLSPFSSLDALSLLKIVLNDMGYTDIEISEMVSKQIVVSTYTNGIVQNMSMTIGEYLSKIIIQKPYLEAGTFRETLEKFCTLAQLKMYSDYENNLPLFDSARPIVSSNNKVIYVPKKNQFGSLSYDLFGKEYTNVNVPYKSQEYSEENLISLNIQARTYPQSFSATYGDDSNTQYKNVISDASVNPNITVLKSSLTSSYGSSRLANYCIVKFTIDKPLDFNNYGFRAIDNVTYFFPNGTNTQMLNQKQNISVDDITIYDSSKTDEDIIYTWLGQVSDEYVGDNADIRIRVNESNIDVFFGFLNIITHVSIPVTVDGYYGNHNIEIYGRNLSSKDVVAVQDANINVLSNELIRIDTTFNNYSINDIIENNIKHDYIKNGTIGRQTISCNNYYYANGEIAKNWLNGEIIDIGDIVQFEGNDKIWRVTGRNFRKTGVPMIDLELQEVRVVE